MTTRVEARDDIMSRFKEKWDTVGHMAVYPDVPLSTAAQTVIDTGSEPWARITVRHNTREQGTLAGPLGSRYDTRGIVFVEVYTPSGDGMTLSDTLSRLVETAFEGVSTPNGLWFRRVRSIEDGPDGHWTKVRVIAEFQYDERITGD